MQHQMLLEASLKWLKLPAMLTHYQAMTRPAEQSNGPIRAAFWPFLRSKPTSETEMRSSGG